LNPVIIATAPGRAPRQGKTMQENRSELRRKSFLGGQIAFA
jgi:hypothetical protein